MGIWGNPAATKKFLLLILGGAPAPPPAYATAHSLIHSVSQSVSQSEFISDMYKFIAT